MVAVVIMLSKCVDGVNGTGLGTSNTNKKVKHYTMMLLIGIWINFTKKAKNPMIRKPMSTTLAILIYSENVIKEVYLFHLVYGIYL